MISQPRFGDSVGIESKVGGLRPSDIPPPSDAPAHLSAVARAELRAVPFVCFVLRFLSSVPPVTRT